MCLHSCTVCERTHVCVFLRERHGRLAFLCYTVMTLTQTVCAAHTNRLPVRVWRYSMALGLGREVYSMCGGQGATQQGKALLSPCHRLVPLRVESASVCMCVSDAVMRVGAQPNGHLTGAVALS